MTKKLLMILSLVGLILSCDLTKNSSCDNIIKEDDNIAVREADEGTVLISNKTDRDIQIHYVMTDSIMTISDMASPIIMRKANLPANSEAEFKIFGYEDKEWNQYTISYFFNDLTEVERLYYLDVER